MNRKQAKAMLPLITAFANGEEVQCKTFVGKDEWYTAEHFSFDGLPSYYRIKPKQPRTRFAVERVVDNRLWIITNDRAAAERHMKYIDPTGVEYHIVEYVEVIKS